MTLINYIVSITESLATFLSHCFWLRTTIFSLQMWKCIFGADDPISLTNMRKEHQNAILLGDSGFWDMRCYLHVYKGYQNCIFHAFTLTMIIWQIMSIRHILSMFFWWQQGHYFLPELTPFLEHFLSLFLGLFNLCDGDEPGRLRNWWNSGRLTCRCLFQYVFHIFSWCLLQAKWMFPSAPGTLATFQLVPGVCPLFVPVRRTS